MINCKVSAPLNNLTMKPEPRPPIYTGFRSPPIMRREDRATVEAFEQAVAAIPTSGKPNGSSVSPATFCASSPPTCPPSPDV